MHLETCILVSGILCATGVVTCLYAMCVGYRTDKQEKGFSKYVTISTEQRGYMSVFTVLAHEDDYELLLNDINGLNHITALRSRDGGSVALRPIEMCKHRP